jgi:hypothetical protein
MLSAVLGGFSSLFRLVALGTHTLQHENSEKLKAAQANLSAGGISLELEC